MFRCGRKLARRLRREEILSTKHVSDSGDCGLDADPLRVAIRANFDEIEIERAAPVESKSPIGSNSGKK